MEYRILNKKNLEAFEYEKLAPYAIKSKDTLGRKYKQSSDPMRTEYQRDRDRIIHSTAFRRLKYKTQVYVIYEGDYYRTRLTHTIEVSQLARSLSTYLNLNPDLTEAISLAHDLGHTPFGHKGEAAMNKLLADEGGFEHNSHSLRVVEVLEERYPDIPGLNLTFEVREGLIKHETIYDQPRKNEYLPDKSPPLESQVVNVADEIAFNNHDLDDALKAQLIDIDDLRELSWLWDLYIMMKNKYPHSPEKFLKYKVITTLIDDQIQDILKTTVTNLENNAIQSIDDVRNCPIQIVSFSPEMKDKLQELKKFLYANVYHHPRVIKISLKAETFITRLFEWYLKYPEQLPKKLQEKLENGQDTKKRIICDYIAGMTDRYLNDEYRRCFEPFEIM